MPHYDYTCTNCRHEEEVFQKMQETALEKCPQCGQPTFRRKVGGGAGLQFHGNGFYVNDYGFTSSPAKNESSNKSSACGCGKSACSS